MGGSRMARRVQMSLISRISCGPSRDPRQPRLRPHAPSEQPRPVERKGTREKSSLIFSRRFRPRTRPTRAPSIRRIGEVASPPLDRPEERHCEPYRLCSTIRVSPTSTESTKEN